MKKLLFSLLLLSVCLGTWAQTIITSGVWKYTTSGNNTTIVGTTETTGTDLVIPGEIDGRTVTGIGANAFKGLTGFTGSLTIPGSVTYIGESAFDGCSGLTGTLTIPSSVKYIWASAFRYCSGFTGALTIPNSVVNIGWYAF